MLGFKGLSQFAMRRPPASQPIDIPARRTYRTERWHFVSPTPVSGKWADEAIFKIDITPCESSKE